MTALLGLPPIGRQAPSEDVAEALRELTAIEFQIGETATDIDVTVAPAQLTQLVEALQARPKLAFDFLRNIVGIDFTPEGMALKYQFYSFRWGHGLQVTVPTSVGHPRVPSIVRFYPAADWHEREAAEMFGFVFDGHPNPKNLLLEEDLHIHPLLKAHPLQPAEILQGIEEGPPGFKI
ncbi:MAG: NADH-quinone oxidoreductase subunit C [Chloroflexi bacterium]|nr:NADH-quinone oxidoreductase subunit C [Chloroflexota bacterium]